MSGRHVVLGYYGMGNFGDDLFCRVLADLIPDARFLAPAAHLPDVESALPTRFPAVSHRSRGVAGSAARLAATLVAAPGVDRVTLGGGSTLQRVAGVLRVQRRLWRAARWQALGVSLGPFASPEDRDDVARVVDDLEHLLVRDHASLEVARSMGRSDAVMSGDLAALSRHLAPGRDGGAEATHDLCLVPCRAPDLPETGQFEFLLDVVRLQPPTARVQVLALNTDAGSGDLVLARDLAARVAATGRSVDVTSASDLGVDATWRAIAASHLVASARLHGAIVAYLTGSEFLLYPYHSKCDHFLRDVGHPQVGQGLDVSTWWEGDRSTRPTMGRHDYIARARQAVAPIVL